MDNFNDIHVDSVNLEYCEKIDDSRMRDFMKTHPQAINCIDRIYDSDSNTVTAIFYSDSIISHDSSKYYAHSKLKIIYQPTTKYNSQHDTEIDSLMKRMSKFGGWVYSSVNIAVIRYFDLDKEVSRGYGH